MQSPPPQLESVAGASFTFNKEPLKFIYHLWPFQLPKLIFQNPTQFSPLVEKFCYCTQKESLPILCLLPK